MVPDLDRGRGEEAVSPVRHDLRDTASRFGDHRHSGGERLDTPLVDRTGKLFPFPLRIGVRPEQQTDVPARHLRTVRRMEFDPKTLIDIEYFFDRLSGPVDPELILVGERNLSSGSKIVPISRIDASVCTKASSSCSSVVRASSWGRERSSRHGSETRFGCSRAPARASSSSAAMRPRITTRCSPSSTAAGERCRRGDFYSGCSRRNANICSVQRYGQVECRAAPGVKSWSGFPS